jgi:tRNA (cmo5U34)-methyltransferase
MLSNARQKLAQFAPSVSFVNSDLKYPEWTNVIAGKFDAVISSIAIHNVTEQSGNSGSDRIRAIYVEIFSLLKPGGCLFNFEFVSPPGPVTEAIYLKKQLDEYQARPKVEIPAESSSKELKAAMCRHLRHPRASLLDQLDWLRQAQFEEVDCLWKDTQRTIIVGFRH